MNIFLQFFDKLINAMDSTVIAAYIGIGGIAFAALLSSLGYFLKTRGDKKKSAKNVLFYLLEIRASVGIDILNPEWLAKEYIDYCNKYLESKGLPQGDYAPPELKKLIYNHFKKQYLATRTKIDQEFIKPFESALVEFSKDDPVLAYQIKGRERLSKIVLIQDEYITEFTKLTDSSGWCFLKDHISSQLDQNNNDLIQNILSDLDDDIRLVSKKCGFFTYLACRDILKNKIEKKVDFSAAGVDEKLDAGILSLSNAVL